MKTVHLVLSLLWDGRQLKYRSAGLRKPAPSLITTLKSRSADKYRYGYTLPSTDSYLDQVLNVSGALQLMKDDNGDFDPGFKKIYTQIGNISAVDNKCFVVIFFSSQDDNLNVEFWAERLRQWQEQEADRERRRQEMEELRRQHEEEQRRRRQAEEEEEQRRYELEQEEAEDEEFADEEEEEEDGDAVGEEEEDDGTGMHEEEEYEGMEGEEGYEEMEEGKEFEDLESSDHLPEPQGEDEGMVVC